MKKIALTLFLITTLNVFSADGSIYPVSDPSIGFSWGVKLMQMEHNNQNFYAAHIPTSETLISLFSNGIYFYSASGFVWGLSEFFFDYTIGAGLRYYPFNNDYFSIYGGCDIGTFFLNNVTLTPKAGADLDFPLNEKTSVYLGGEYFNRNSYEVIEYMDNDKWYISSDGWAINAGFRIRVNLFEKGLDALPKTL